MRLALPVLLAATVIAPVQAQSATDQWLVGPSFGPSATTKENFDAKFLVDVKMAGVPVLRNQAADARYDAIVCNLRDSKIKGGVRVDGKGDRWSVLAPDNCTMFANFSQLELTPMEPGGEWKAEVYLRAHR
jgi:hypothetical protein